MRHRRVGRWTSPQSCDRRSSCLSFTSPSADTSCSSPRTRPSRASPRDRTCVVGPHSLPLFLSCLRSSFVAAAVVHVDGGPEGVLRGTGQAAYSAPGLQAHSRDCGARLCDCSRARTRSSSAVGLSRTQGAGHTAAAGHPGVGFAPARRARRRAQRLTAAPVRSATAPVPGPTAATAAAAPVPPATAAGLLSFACVVGLFSHEERRPRAPPRRRTRSTGPAPLRTQASITSIASALHHHPSELCTL